MLDSAITRQCEARIGTTLRGKWTLERLLGIGGMAAVYVGQHKIGRRDAIKILHPEFARSKELCARFEQEARAVNGFSHPGAVEIRDIDVAEDGCPFLVMELLEGESLQERAARLGGLPETELLRVIDEVLDVLAAAHAQGIVHRDIKLDNVFLTNDGRVEVLDFGIARVRSSKQVLTMTGSRLGTAAYMAPEQVRGEEVDGRVDIFAVGATMFRLLAKRRIHEADNEAQLLVKMSTEAAPPLLRVAPGVNEHLAMVVDRALSFDRAKRYPSALAMQGDVRALREGQPPAFALGRLADEAASGTGAPAGTLLEASAAAFAMEPTGAASPAAFAQSADAAARTALAAETTAATASEVAPTVAKRHATVALGPSTTDAMAAPSPALGPDSMTSPGETIRRVDATATPPPGSLMAPMSQARPPIGAMTPPPGSLMAPMSQARPPVGAMTPLPGSLGMASHASGQGEPAAPTSMRSPHQAAAFPSAYVTAAAVAERPGSRNRLGWVLGAAVVGLLLLGGGGWLWAQRSAAEAARLASDEAAESDDEESEDEYESPGKRKPKREAKGGAAADEAASAEAARVSPTASPKAGPTAGPTATARPTEAAAARAPGAWPTSNTPSAAAKSDLEPAPSLASPKPASASGAGATQPAAQPAATATSTQVVAAPAPSPAPTTAGGTSPRPGPSSKSSGGKLKSPR